MEKALVDENLSPTLVQRLATKGIYAQHVVHIGLGSPGRGKPSASDSELFRKAFEEDQVVITQNTQDFVELTEDVDLHCGLIAIRVSGHDAAGQWALLEPVIDHIQRQKVDLTNKIVEIWGIGDFEISDLPAT